MADCCSNYSKSCPEPISTVNISVTNNTFNLEGAGALYRQEILTLTQVSGQEWSAVLADTPFSDFALQIYINGLLQELGDDYVRTDRVVLFDFPPEITAAEVAQMKVVAIYSAVNYVASDTPVDAVGTIKVYADDDGPIPVGWLVCDGSAVSRSTYAALFAVIGESYGNGNGSTTFNLPPSNIITLNIPGAADPVSIIKY